MRYFLIALIMTGLISIFTFPETFFNLETYFNNKEVILGQSNSQLPVPQKSQNWQSPPQISAKSAVIIDADTGIHLYEKDPDIRLLPASTSKLMTALVALKNCSPEKIVTVTFREPTPTQMGLKVGDIVTIETLLYGLLIASGNDAAYALASSCAPSPEEFINEMNQMTRLLSMRNTNFANPAGFDDPNQYSTAGDLAKLAKVAVANPLIATIVSTKSIVLTDVTGTKPYYLENINKLLQEVEGVEGVKTGQTEGSLEILLSKITREKHTIIVAVLGSHDRFGESEQLIEWTFKNYQWVNP